MGKQLLSQRRDRAPTAGRLGAIQRSVGLGRQIAAERMRPLRDRGTGRNTRKRAHFRLIGRVDTNCSPRDDENAVREHMGASRRTGRGQPCARRLSRGRGGSAIGLVPTLVQTPARLRLGGADRLGDALLGWLGGRANRFWRAVKQ